MLNFKVETVLDDRKMKIGFKMKDWELIGIPYIVVVGRRASENIVELKNRNDNSKVELTLEEVKEFIIDKVNNLKIKIIYKFFTFEFELHSLKIKNYQSIKYKTY